MNQQHSLLDGIESLINFAFPSFSIKYRNWKLSDDKCYLTVTLIVNSAYALNQLIKGFKHFQPDSSYPIEVFEPDYEVIEGKTKCKLQLKIPALIN